ncbi:MAG: class I SAM-dependent methyltransferase [Clostridiales bacterium]|jgi:ubiquinone/menaquinone biosynthesis C-methylase UbiE|nr:class I SAM-dependent methyltransferase [Clostridiales bacterium]
MRIDKVGKAYTKKASLYNKTLSGKSLWSTLVTSMVWGMKDASYIEERVVDNLDDNFSGRLLDVPVGTGLFTKNKYARMKNADITGLDYSQGMLDKAKEAYDEAGAAVKLQQGDVANMPFADGDFDMVLCMNGLPCFPEKEQSIREIMRTLKTGGDLVGCSYIKGARKMSDFFIKQIYTRMKFTTPPYKTKAELTATLEQYFTKIDTWEKGALLGFECRGKR